VQTQKLASLAQLTAGIAHEIKNPLNFVNNFSGISVELIDELEETLENVKAMRHALQSLNSRIPCGAISIRSFSTASVQIPSSRTCCCTRARVQGFQYHPGKVH
jgi:C4-dicarboxylate-specific signal transduction histidine kinase